MVVHCKSESEDVRVGIVLVNVLLVGQPHQVSLQLQVL